MEEIQLNVPLSEPNMFRIEALGDNDIILSSIQFLSKYYDSRRFDVFGKALERLYQELDYSKNLLNVRKYKVSEFYSELHENKYL